MYGSYAKDTFVEEIASKLNITRFAVYKHCSKIRKKTNTNNRLAMLYVLCNEENYSLEHLKLTKRGKEVFQLHIKGYDYLEITCKLNLSYSTVRTHFNKMVLDNNCTTMRKLIAKYYAQDEKAVL